MSSAPTTIEELESLCFNLVAEGLQIEFKQKEDASTPTLGKGDKRSIAEAISSFANSDGGTLIYGVKTQRHGGVDVAAQLTPIADVNAFETNFRTVCALNISPTVAQLTIRSILVDGSTRGYLVCEVVRSPDRPHMSTAPGVHSYFRRSFEGSVPMTPSEIRDQILAVRDALLEPMIRMGGHANMTNHGQHMSLAPSTTVLLKNKGRVLCKNPFLRLRTTSHAHSHIDLYDPVLDAFKTVFPYGTLIPVGDELRCVSLSWSAVVDFIELSNLFERNADDLTSAVLLLPHMNTTDMITVSDKTSLESVLFEISFGAENAPLVIERETLRRSDFARSLLSDSTVQSMFLASYSPWRSDLVDRFRSLAPELWNWIPQPLVRDVQALP